MSDGAMAVRLWHTSSIDSDNVMEYIGVSEAEAEDYKADDYGAALFETEADDMSDLEMISRFPVSIEYAGILNGVAAAYKTAHGLLLLDSERLAVFGDPRCYDYYLSKKAPHAVLVVQNKVVYGMIMPLKYDCEKLEKELLSIASAAGEAHVQGLFDIGHQITLDELDSDTEEAEE